MSERGDQGATGDKGSQGATGDTGSRGEAGERGDTGSRGVAGERGPKGDHGQGEQGRRGLQGERGLIGSIGPRARGIGALFLITVAYITFTLWLSERDSCIRSNETREVVERKHGKPIPQLDCGGMFPEK